jgi:hypothetical protein
VMNDMDRTTRGYSRRKKISNPSVIAPLSVFLLCLLPRGPQRVRVVEDWPTSAVRVVRPLYELQTQP